MRIRVIRKIGNSWFIKLKPIDLKDKEWKEGDEVDIENLKLKELKGGKK